MKQIFLFHFSSKPQPTKLMEHFTADDNSGNKNADIHSTDIEPRNFALKEEEEEEEEGGNNAMRMMIKSPPLTRNLSISVYYECFSKKYPHYDDLVKKDPGFAKTLPYVNFMGNEHFIAYLASRMIRDKQVKNLVLVLSGKRSMHQTRQSLLYIESKRVLLQNAEDEIRFVGGVTVQFNKSRPTPTLRGFGCEDNTAFILHESVSKEIGSGMSKVWLEHLMMFPTMGIPFTALGVSYRSNGTSSFEPFSQNRTLTTWTFPKDAKSLFLIYNSILDD